MGRPGGGEFVGKDDKEEQRLTVARHARHARQPQAQETGHLGRTRSRQGGAQLSTTQQDAAACDPAVSEQSGLWHDTSSPPASPSQQRTAPVALPVSAHTVSPGVNLYKYRLAPLTQYFTQRSLPLSATVVYDETSTQYGVSLSR